ncbi:MAG TPA: pyridoxamine 5'-phosphate oxidase family protein [Candidatus Dormibacteraeota bacterium]|nr:pyridoxamine 5'-phosphate oxidase family protein [Candidatus Dormibacteraeota bacterium]
MEAKNLDIYGHEPIAWDRVLQQLERTDYKATHWLATTGPDGRPHVAGVGAMWDGGKFYVVSGPKTRKSMNLARDDRCTIAVSMPDVDLVVEGKATMVRDAATLDRLAKRYAAQGWPAEARDGAITAPYSAPSAGPGPWNLYEFTPETATAVATEEPHGATRWRLRQ